MQNPEMETIWVPFSPFLHQSHPHNQPCLGSLSGRGACQTCPCLSLCSHSTSSSTPTQAEPRGPRGSTISLDKPWVTDHLSSTPY